MIGTREDDKVIVRLPNGLRPAIKARAALNRRSMNSEIVLLIESALQHEQGQPQKN